MGSSVILKLLWNISFCFWHPCPPLLTPVYPEVSHFSPWWDWLGQACFCFMNDLGLGHWSRWGDSSDRYNPFKSEEWNCTVRDHEHPRHLAESYVPIILLIEKPHSSSFTLSELCSTSNFSLYVSWRALPDVTNGSSWSGIWPQTIVYDDHCMHMTFI